MRLDQALRANKGIGPGFHFLRHILSWAILTTHTWYAIRGTAPISGSSHPSETILVTHSLINNDFGRELLRPTLFALVGMFFALSGFLIAGSAARTRSVKSFFTNRALRLLPALSVEVTLSALLLGPLVTIFSLREYFSDYAFFRYFGNMIGHVSYVLPGVFVSNPWANVVNATLWTLPAELWCYAIMLCLLLAGVVKNNRWLSISVFGLIVLAIALIVYNPALFSVRQDTTHYTSWYIVVMFLFGVLAFANAKHIVLSRTMFLFSIVLYYAMMETQILDSLSGIPLTYCVIFIGMTPFPLIDKIIPVDLSYGIYLYGFPITQFVIFQLDSSLRGFGNITMFFAIYPLVVVFTILFALTSWLFLEKPALSLRGHILREPPRGG